MTRIELLNPHPGLISKVQALRSRGEIRCHYIHGRYIALWYDHNFMIDEVLSIIGGQLIHPDLQQLRNAEREVLSLKR
jgi:hypothetical protein